MRPMRVEVLTHESKLLAENPLGDPARRDVVVMLPPSYDATSTRRYPVVLLLAGFGGNGWQLAFNRAAWQTPLPARLGAAMRAGAVKGGDRRRARLLLALRRVAVRRLAGASGATRATCATSWCPSSTGRCARFRSARRARWSASRRAATARWCWRCSGPTWSARSASHAGDGAFDISYLRELPHTVLALEKRGGLAAFLRWFEAQPQKGQQAFEVMSNLCCAAAWSPSPTGPYGFGVGFDLPVSLVTAALIPSLSGSAGWRTIRCA